MTAKALGLTIPDKLLAQILAHAIVKEGAKGVAAGMNPRRRSPTQCRKLWKFTPSRLTPKRFRQALQKLLKLVDVCEEASNNIEGRLTSG
jgi:hypothetical protein